MQMIKKGRLFYLNSGKKQAEDVLQTQNTIFFGLIMLLRRTKINKDLVLQSNLKRLAHKWMVSISVFSTVLNHDGICIKTGNSGRDSTYWDSSIAVVLNTVLQ
jgi:hypothetical protein